MLGALGILFISCLLGWFEVRSLFKRKLKKEGIVVIILLFIGTSCIMMLAFKIPIPNPSELLMFLFQPITNEVDYMFR